MEIFICTEGTSNKFWAYELSGNDIIVMWGRIGTSGQQKTHNAFSFNLTRAISEKIDKGYVKTSKEHYQILTEIAKVIGTNFSVKLSIVANTRLGLIELSKNDLMDPKNEPYILATVIGTLKDGVVPKWQYLINSNGMYDLKLNTISTSKFIDGIELAIAKTLLV